ncbi:uncharacterized protein BYT42DRAFT_304420 [Radiomyces spectabilis]|uniref:uncharacterized protein n=1 Tax=Radiomyces spectabilis TaxID=64574 RepID=UPI00221FDBC9|nr:uncharacterized protein BYT42DRAFT_304420 [Radiomyces spectabilis]KAI8381412.1 hypothetical protein BYT42DRAFT_304420 [Radiomyces spectabilis]
MASQDGVPFIVYIPFILCILSILFLLSLRRRQQQLSIETDVWLNNDEVNEDLTLHEVPANEDSADEMGDQPVDPEEGSSTAVRIKKVGKKRGKKLQRKEHMRQYHEYMLQQRDARRAQEEAMAEQFQRRKAEEAIRLADEIERRRKEMEKKLKNEEKERQKQQKAEAKLSKAKQAKYEKYHARVANIVKREKVCTSEYLANEIRIDEKDVQAILEQLCATDLDFELSLWNGTTFFFVTRNDYEGLDTVLANSGKIRIDDVLEHGLSFPGTSTNREV